jgi:hypothetical protein
MHQLETLMAQKFHNGGRTYAVGKAETDGELAARLAAGRARDARLDPDFNAKAPMYRTAAVRGHVVTNGGAGDLEEGTIVGVRFRLMAYNAMRRIDEPVFTVTLQNGRVWGDLYASALCNFVL